MSACTKCYDLGSLRLIRAVVWLYGEMKKLSIVDVCYKFPFCIESFDHNFMSDGKANFKLQGSEWSYELQVVGHTFYVSS